LLEEEGHDPENEKDLKGSTGRDSDAVSMMSQAHVGECSNPLYDGKRREVN